MSAPLDFLKIFASQLRQVGIRFAITSGMACVHYGLQQTTKDSDWIIAPDDLGKLRELLMRLDQAAPPWRVSYRQIFGAPLDPEFMAHGWTSHLYSPTALRRAAVRANRSPEQIAQLHPPLTELLP